MRQEHTFNIPGTENMEKNDIQHTANDQKVWWQSFARGDIKNQFLQANNDQGGVAEWLKIADAIEWIQSPPDLIGDTPH